MCKAYINGNRVRDLSDRNNLDLSGRAEIVRGPKVAIMKKYLFAFLVVCFLFTSSAALASLTGLAAHEKYLYPVVRVSAGNSTGSGTIVYSKDIGDGKHSTYVLTNHHVIASAIRITDEWDSDLGKEVKKEIRAIIYVEIFKYRNLSSPVGTMKLEADIVIYNKAEDMALVKIRLDDKMQYVATLPDKDKTEEYRVFDESIAVGCSLGWPTLPSIGIITRIGLQARSLPFDMSSAQIIFGNSGGAMFTAEGVLIGIPSMIASMGWSGVVSHMGLFIPIKRVYDWLEDEHYDFIFDPEKDEKMSLEIREKEIEEKKKAAKE